MILLLLFFYVVTCRQFLIPNPNFPLLWSRNSVTGYFDVPVEIDGAFSKFARNEIIVWSLEHIESGSNIRFRPYTEQDKSRIVFVPGESCMSIVGRDPYNEPQKISLAIPGCLFRHAVLHEILHALGLNHEHQRPEGSSVYIVDIDRAPIGYAEDHVWPITNVLGPKLREYDVASIMHYNMWLNATNTTLQPILDARSATLSSCDWNTLNTLYPGKQPAPECIPNEHRRVCESVPNCAYGEVVCDYICQLDCDIGLPRGDIPDTIPLYPNPLCRYIGGGRFPLLPPMLEVSFDNSISSLLRK